MNETFFETVKIVDKKIYNLSYHQKRLDGVFESFSSKNIIDLSTIIKPTQDGLLRCKVIYSLDGDYSVEYFPYKKRNIQKLFFVDDESIEYKFKSTAREKLDALYAKRGECDDVLICKNNLLTDTTIANIALYDGAKWWTPKHPLLQGTTRARLLEQKKIFEKNIEVDRVFEYKKIAMMNAMVDFDIIPQENIRNIIVRKCD